MAEHEEPKKKKVGSGRVKVSFWMTKDEKALLADAAGREGVNMSDMMRILLIRNAKREGLL